MANEVVLKTIFQLKRGTSERWRELNPILRQGEPGFVIDLNLLKIGDGVTPWQELDYIEGLTGGIKTVTAFSGLPEIGDPTVVYRVVADRALYQYNSETSTYEPLGGAVAPAQQDTYGTIKGSNDFTIKDGVVSGISTDLLFQGDLEIIFDGGDAE